jgi:glucosylceramidase
MAGDVELVTLLQEILALNPAIKIMAAPWSAPAWMKNNSSFIAGKLKPEYYPVYAQYFVKYLQAMQDHGIPIQAISVQNEPLNGENNPSMVMDAEEQAEFIKNYLGIALRDAGFAQVEILCWDHNCDRLDYPLSVLADSAARQFISGVAWHLYAGDISALSKVQQAYPSIHMYFTEQWVGTNGTFAGDLAWHIRHVLIGSLRNHSRAVLEWNLASQPYYDPANNTLYHLPHTLGGCCFCVGALSITDDRIDRNVAYYVIAHAAKFVRPGAMRIGSSELADLPNVAFQTLDGNIVLIVLNERSEEQSFSMEYKQQTATATLASGAVATYMWPC